MAQNFDQKKMLEENNTNFGARASSGGKFAVYLSFIFIIPIFLYVKRRNDFKRQQEKMLEQLSNIDAKLTERYNVLTNQITVAKEALKHETGLQTAVTNARATATATAAGGQVDPQTVMEKNNLVGGLASRWNIAVENYPQLVTMPVLQDLAGSVKDLEADLEASRRFYTAVARAYNSDMQTWPGSVAADDLQLKRFPMFEAEDGKREFVELKF